MAVYGPGPENSPMSPLNKSLWSIMYYSIYHADFNRFNGNILLLNNGAINTSVGNSLTSLEAFAIDSKLDDSLPTTGKVQVNPHSTGCYGGSPAAYNTTGEGLLCALVFPGVL